MDDPCMSGRTGAGTFLWMWAVMMIPMMLPSLVPALSRYRRAVGDTGDAHLGRLTAIVATAYFVVWVAFGLIVFPVGVALATVAMQRPALARAVPMAAAVVVLLAGALQFTAWKAHQLACCRESPARALPPDNVTAWRHGLRLGFHCSICTAGLTAILLVLGVMDPRVMAAVTVAVTAERLARNGELVARAIGVIVVGVGLLLMARAAGFVR